MEAWIVAALIAAGTVYLWNRWRQLARIEFIRNYTFPHGLFAKLNEKRPQLDTKQMQLVARALRQFFLAYLRGGRQYVSMPSQVTDDLWHEFILYTRHYDAFCRRAFGGFLHHTPAVVLSRERQNNSGLRRVWWHSCKEENINPRKPTRLPLLFALDSKLGIADGFVYRPDCKKVRASGDSSVEAGIVYCGGDFCDTSFDGSIDGFGSGDSSFGDAISGSDVGSGCGGDSGCGGGCGGGGD
ncbi:MAG TPA: hypothetical protein VJ299_00395 [Steroidobacteraceae bacterium]|jgi:hypothetical protein|nr:hypothetical protein [Steroidobacteraceae bacterium]